MYSASADFQTKIKSNIRKLSWSGTITTSGGNTYTFTNADIVGGGSITRSISSQTLNIGTAYASTFSIELVLADVSRYELFGAEVSVSVSLDGASDVIPMGIFIISEASQTFDHISIKAYDYMIKFDDVPFNPAVHNTIKKPYVWLSDLCSACGVTLGMTQAEIEAMPNGKRDVGYADVVSDVKSWRDVIGYLSALLGGYALIGRDGKLYIGSYNGTADDTVPASFRYSSNLSDYRTTYNGIYGVFKEKGVQEYVANENEDGLVLDLQTNPFMQFTVENNRLRALGEIINVWNDLYYVPFDSNMPLIPTYDPGDVLSFTGNQAGEYDIGVITEIVYTIGGQMRVSCSGDNPRLAEAQDRFAKTIEGVSNEYTNTRNIGGKDFWILSTTNTDAITVGGTELLIAEIEWYQKTYVQDIEMLLTVDAVLSATANVVIRLTVDDDEDFEMLVTESKSLKGERVFHCTNPQKITGDGYHTAKVYMTVTDSPLLVGDLV